MVATASNFIIPQKWRDLFALIPNYDPIATAGPGDYFDSESADRACDFFPECLRHIEGELAGKPFVLELWQQAIIGCLFGWKRKDDYGREVRRYRECLLYVPRKNGKTPLAAGINILVLFCDGEAGAQVYGAASDAKQAGLLFRQAAHMVAMEPELKDRADVYNSTSQRAIVLKADPASSYQVISAEAYSKHGYNIHMFSVDELHAQPNRELIDVLRTGMASVNRKQPLALYLTTADVEGETICNEVYDTGKKVCSGALKDPRFLPVIFEAQKEDDWTEPEVWRKCNPNLGVSVSLDFLRRECEKAKSTPAYQANFKRYHLNVRTNASNPWISLDTWDRNACTPAPHPVGRCYAGLDMSAVRDMTALVLGWPSKDGPWIVKSYCWCPRVSALERQQANANETPYLAWAEKGFVELCEGDVIDYDMVERRILELHLKHGIIELAIDPGFQGFQIAQNMAKRGITVVHHQQGGSHMAAPVKYLTELVLSQRFNHGGHPVMRWHASNVQVKKNGANQDYFHKASSHGKIDLMVAAAMMVSRAMAGMGQVNEYASRGITVLGG